MKKFINENFKPGTIFYHYLIGNKAIATWYILLSNRPNMDFSSEESTVFDISKFAVYANYSWERLQDQLLGHHQEPWKIEII